MPGPSALSPPFATVVGVGSRPARVRSVLAPRGFWCRLVVLRPIVSPSALKVLETKTRRARALKDGIGYDELMTESEATGPFLKMVFRLNVKLLNLDWQKPAAR